MLITGRIIKVNSGLYRVKTDNSELFECVLRGKIKYHNINPLVGDYVLIDVAKKTVEKILDRKNFLLRPPVANIDKALIVTSVKKPNLSLQLLDKLISIVTINNIEPIIILTKIDLLNKEDLQKITEL